MSEEAVQSPESVLVRVRHTSQALGESVAAVCRRARGLRAAFEDCEGRGVAKGRFCVRVKNS